MNIFTQSQLRTKKILLFIALILFILIYLVRGQQQLTGLWQQSLLFIFAYGVGLFLMLGDEKYLQKIYVEELKQKTLITRNPLFLISLPFLSIFILTSTGSVAGIALILAINLVIFIEIFQLAPQIQKFNQYFLIGIKKKITKPEIKTIKIACFIYFLILLFLLC
jgi:hypothetical protein